MRHAIPFVCFLLLTLAGQGLAQEVDLNAPGRRPAEVARDASSKPVEVLEWIDLDSGAAIADLYSGSGYHSWIFSQWVGPEGIVFSQSARLPDSLKARIESGDMATGNVVYVATIQELPDDSLDLAFTDRNYHDMPEDRIGEILTTIKSKLKPGGLFVVIDARAAEGRDKDAHRIADTVIIAEVTGAGFELVESSEMLANPADDHVGGDFESRDTLDRSLLKFRKLETEDEGTGGGSTGHGSHASD
jgi:predicted methyltransferase